MINDPVRIIGTAIGLMCLTSFVQKWWMRLKRRRCENAFGAARGCQAVEAIPTGKWPWNLDLVIGLIAANNNERTLSFQQQFLDKLGPNIEQRLLGDVGYVTLDPENVKAVLSKLETGAGELDYDFGLRRDAFFPMLGEGIFTQDGPPWKHSRRTLAKQFARIQYQNLDIFAGHVEKLVSRIETTKGSVIDLKPLFFNYTLDTTTTLLFGESSNTLDESSGDTFEKYFDEASWITALRVKLVSFYWLYTPRRYTRACNEVKNYADSFVRKALDNSFGSEAGSDRYWLIRSLYEDLQDRSLVRDQLINILLAGRDTTACMLCWAVRLLIRHQEVLKRLRQEISAIVGTSRTISRPQLQNMPCLKDVLDETLRLYPSVPINVRTASRVTTLPRGGGPDGQAPVLVRKGQGVGLAPYHMHRRKDLYGSDAHKFRPDRWKDGTLERQVGWGYLPFNGGPRKCLGKEFALLECSYALVRIIQAFPKLGLPSDEKLEPTGSERQTLTFTVSPAEGCRVKIS